MKLNTNTFRCATVSAPALSPPHRHSKGKSLVMIAAITVISSVLAEGDVIGRKTNHLEDAATEEALATMPAFESLTHCDSGGYNGRGTGKRMTINGEEKWLTPDEKAKLHELVRKVKMPEIKKYYAGGGDSDGYQDHLKVTINGKVWQTNPGQGGDLPKELKSLLAYIYMLYDKQPKTSQQPDCKFPAPL